MLTSLRVTTKRINVIPLFSNLSFFVLFSLLAVFTQAQTINAPTLSPAGPYCEGASVTVSFTTSGTFNTGNIFTAQLSEANGSFTGSGIDNIGTLSQAGDNPSGSISAVIPTNTAAGTTYRIRVISSNPAVNGASNTNNLTIVALPTAFDVTGGGAFCSGGAGPEIGLSGSETGVNYQLKRNGANFGTALAGTGSALNFGNKPFSGTYTIVATKPASPGCSTTMNGSTVVSINPSPRVFDVTGGGAYCAGGAGPEVRLSGSQVGVNYTLFRLDENNTSHRVRTDAGTGAAINFGNKPLAGTYTVIATNTTTNCTSDMNGSATVTINPIPTATVNQTNVLCFGASTGSITVVGNGAGPFTYALNFGQPQSSGTFSNLLADTFRVTLTDQTTGCFDTLPPIIITQPDTAVSVVIVSKQGGCNTNLQTKGNITLRGTGGTGPFTFTNGTGAPQEDSTFTGLDSGSYIFTITDVNGCSIDTAIEIFPFYAVVYAQHPKLCSVGDSTFIIAVARETVPAAYQYSFFQGNGTPLVEYPGKYLLSVKEGTYFAKVKDTTGCEYTSDLITVTDPDSSLTLNATATRISCSVNGGKITAMGSGGYGSYRYSVDNPFTYQTNPVFTGLAAGNRRLRVIDSTGYCTVTKIVTVSPALTSATIKVGDTLLCAGGTTYLAAYPKGGTKPFRYRLSNTAYFQSQSTFTVRAGTYFITVIDSAGCVVQARSVTITESAPIVLASKQITNVSCSGGADGAFTVTAGGGQAPYQYRLGYTNSFQSSGTFTGLTAANYRLTVKDADGCTVLFIIPVTQSKTPCAQGKATRDLYVNNKGTSNVNNLSVRVAPNPSKSGFTLITKSSKKENLQIKVLDMQGRQVHAAAGSANQTYRFGSHFAPGMYAVEILQGARIQTIKVIKSE